MLNYFAFDIDEDRAVLEKSYEQILHKERLEVITDENVKTALLREVFSALTIPNNAVISFQNLFKETLSNGTIYLAQCLVDFGYPVSAKLAQSYLRQYNFQVIGFATLNLDLGNTILRPETRLDKISSRLFNYDIDLLETDKFNDKYYLVSNKKATVVKHFKKQFVNTIAKHNDIIIITKGRKMYVTFDSDIRVNQMRAIEDVFYNCDFLSA